MREESAISRRFSLPYRTPYELYAAGVWALGCTYLVLISREAVLPRFLCALFLAGSFAMLLYRLYAGCLILRARSLLSGRRLELTPLSQAKKAFKEGFVCIGYGFDWKPEHTQKLHDLSRLNIASLQLPEWMHCLFNRQNAFQRKEEIGMPYLHGLDAEEKPLLKAIKNFEGGLLILGTTQAGKGVMQIYLGTQAILRGDVVIYIDPKGSNRMYEGFCRACEAAGRGKPLRYHPGNRSKTEGIRIDPLATFNTGAQIATRIVSVIAGQPTVYTQFAWACIKTFADALIEIGQKPSLKLLSQHINEGIEGLLRPLLKKLVAEHAEDHWKEKARSFMPKRKDQNEAEDELLLLVSWYENVLPSHLHTMVVGECLKIFHHSKEHYAKITATLMPIFAMLTSGPLEESLSPTADDAEDYRPIWDMESIIRTKSVLYLNLDSLSDNTVASAIGALLLADTAAIAGKRYNLGKNDVRISLFVDEASNVINQPLIELLNKGAEGGVYTTVAMQTIADLANRLGSQDAARMVLGNCNNLIALRCKDRPTQDFVTETFGKTYIHHVDTTLSTHADTQAGLPSFRKFTKCIST